MTNEEAISILQKVTEKLSKSGEDGIAQALNLGRMALLALGDIPIEGAAAEIQRLHHVDRQMAFWFPASYEHISEWNEA